MENRQKSRVDSASVVDKDGVESNSLLHQYMTDVPDTPEERLAYKLSLLESGLSEEHASILSQ